MNYPKFQFFLFMLFILSLSSIPGRSIPDTISWITWDKAIHFIEYFFLSVLGYRAFYKDKNFNIYVLCIICILFGCFDEIWQSFVPGRIPSHYDVIADGLGVMFGLWLSHLYIDENL